VALLPGMPNTSRPHKAKTLPGIPCGVDSSSKSRMAKEWHTVWQPKQPKFWNGKKMANLCKPPNCRNSKKMAKTRGFAIFLPCFCHFFAIPICHPPCHSQREPQFHQALFWPSLLLFNLILPTNAGPVVSVVWDDRAAACPNVSEMRVAFPDVLYTEEQR